jgi:uncharacterized sodium:solute symporter family permease YidK
MMFIQVFYWSTNQVIVQRAMAAKSLAEGQKGVLFASAMKLVGPLMLCLPGIIALHMTDLTIDKQDQVYGAIVRHVLPDWSLGLFAAVLMGSILSSFNSALNSASTLFSLQFYKGYINKEASGNQIAIYIRISSKSERTIQCANYRDFSIRNYHQARTCNRGKIGDDSGNGFLRIFYIHQYPGCAGNLCK